MYFVVMTLAAAATPHVSPPQLAAAINNGDYPGWALSDESSAASYFHAEVSASGKVSQCNPITHVGNERLANEICKILKRKRVSPAIGNDGHALPASYDTSLKFFLPGTKEGDQVRGTEFDRPADIDVSVKNLPGGVSQSEILIAVSLDQKGKVTGCSALNARDNAALVSAGCSVASNYEGSVLVDNKGATVPYLTTLKVSFAVASSGSR